MENRRLRCLVSVVDVRGSSRVILESLLVSAIGGVTIIRTPCELSLLIGILDEFAEVGYFWKGDEQSS